MKPWETKTVEHLTQAEVLEWIEWTMGRNIPGRQAWQVAQDILHNVLLWERSKSIAPATEHKLQVGPGGLKSFFWKLSQEEQFAVVRGARLQASLDDEWVEADRIIPGPHTEVRIHPDDQHLVHP